MLIVETIARIRASTSSRQDDQGDRPGPEVSRNTVRSAEVGRDLIRVRACCQPRPKLDGWAAESRIAGGNAAKSAREQLTLIRISRSSAGRYGRRYDAVRVTPGDREQEPGIHGAAYVPLTLRRESLSVRLEHEVVLSMA